MDTLPSGRAFRRRRGRRRAAGRLRKANYAVGNLKMGKRSNSLGEHRDWVIDEVGEAEVVNCEDENGMNVGVEASDVGRKDRNRLRYGDELSRLCLGCFRHTRRRSMVEYFVVSQQLRLP